MDHRRAVRMTPLFVLLLFLPLAMPPCWAEYTIERRDNAAAQSWTTANSYRVTV